MPFHVQVLLIFSHLGGPPPHPLHSMVTLCSSVQFISGIYTTLFVQVMGKRTLHTISPESTECVGSAVDGWCPPLPSGQVMTPNVQSSRVIFIIIQSSYLCNWIGVDRADTTTRTCLSSSLYFQFPKYNYYGH